MSAEREGGEGRICRLQKALSRLKTEKQIWAGGTQPRMWGTALGGEAWVPLPRREGFRGTLR